MINHNNQIPKPKQLQFAAVKDDVLNNYIGCVRDCSGILFTKSKKIQRKARPNFCHAPAWQEEETPKKHWNLCVTVDKLIIKR